MKKIDPVYRKKIEQIKIDGEDYSDEEMLPVYAEQKKELDALHTVVGAMFIKYAVDGLLKMNAAQKVSMGFNETLKTMGKDLGNTEVEKVTEILSKVYQDTYNKNAFVMESGMKVNLKFNILKPEFVNAAVNAKYKGEFFSDRIWTNKADMIDKLQSSLIDRQIRDQFNVTAYESKRLVNTETARIQTQASYDIGISTGVEEVMWSATLDMKTAPEDAELDGKIWGINEDHPEPPLHPDCRCELINVPYAGWNPSARKDNETGKIIAYTNYADWAKDKGIGGGNNE
jgi:SPP1 gp7 family putative phage head morphogenesis protein